MTAEGEKSVGRKYVFFSSQPTPLNGFIVEHVRAENYISWESGSARRSSFCGFFTRPKGQTRLLVKCMIFTQMFTHRLLLFFINIPLSPSRALNKFLRSTYKFFEKLFFIDCPRCFYIKLIFLCMESNQGLAHASPSQWAQKISQQ